MSRSLRRGDVEAAKGQLLALFHLPTRFTNEYLLHADHAYISPAIFSR